MYIDNANLLGEVHLSIEWAARLEGITPHHARRLARNGSFPGAFRRGGDGRWLIPLSSVTRTLDGTIRHWMNQPIDSGAA